jgi:hypothetical protein
MSLQHAKAVFFQLRNFISGFRGHRRELEHV